MVALLPEFRVEGLKEAMRIGIPRVPEIHSDGSQNLQFIRKIRFYYQVAQFHGHPSLVEGPHQG